MGRFDLLARLKRKLTRNIQPPPVPVEPENVHCRCETCVYLPADHPERVEGIGRSLARKHIARKGKAFPSEEGPGWDALGKQRPYPWQSDSDTSSDDASDDPGQQDHAQAEPASPANVPPAQAPAAAHAVPPAAPAPQHAAGPASGEAAFRLLYNVQCAVATPLEAGQNF